MAIEVIGTIVSNMIREQIFEEIDFFSIIRDLVENRKTSNGIIILVRRI